MGTKKQKGSISIEKINDRIRLRWRYQTTRYSLNLFLFSKANLIKAQRIALLIEQDILLDSFDTSLVKYKPAIPNELVKENKTIVQYFEGWVKNYRNMDCETDVDYNSTRNMIKKWGKFYASTVVAHLNTEKFGAKTYNRRLTLLKAFFKWAVKSKLFVENPLDDVLPKKVRKTEKANRKPFTEDEIRRILDAFKNNSFCPKGVRFKHSHYYSFLYFIFKTGVRNAEAVGLRKQYIDLSTNQIIIKEVLARTIKGTNAAARIRKETKNGKHRVLPLTEDLKSVLLPLLYKKKPDDLVFTSHKGKAIDDSMFQKRVFRKVLKGLNISHRVLYACRHTFNSRCIEAGITPVMAAFLMGNNPETALRNYTHLLNLPLDLPSIPQSE
jgi:integrase